MALASFPTELRGAYIKKDKEIRVCAEPFPDVAASNTLEVLAKLSGGQQGKVDVPDTFSSEGSANVAGELATKSGTQVLQLGGRSGAVLLGRELLYRMCEAHSNGLLDPNQGGEAVVGGQTKSKNADMTPAVLIYTKTIDAIVKIAESERLKAEASKKQADAEDKKQQAALLKARTDLAKSNKVFRACAAAYDKCVAGATGDAAAKAKALAACEQARGKCEQKGAK
ncbi:MAG: hypothetical protein AAFU79_03520 [Myxococcota bacterium]